MSHITSIVSIETALRLVADQRRRSVLTRLIEHEDDAVTLDGLADDIAPENPPPRAGESLQTQSLLLDLHHNHLPRLEAAGLIEYDDRTETIRYRPNERVEKLNRFVTTELGDG